LTFIEQHEDSLSYAWFLLPTDIGLRWIADIPAGRHNGSAALAFSDGHVETKKWTDPRTVPPVRKMEQNYDPAALADNPDLEWLSGKKVQF
jgi:prepilin-type processing-associated H-X9-DG protein